jgi:5-(carboxyamino)imidazole ribonucleotide synthase
MKSFEELNFKLGILGGGQLGKMLLQAASPWHLHTSVLDPNEQCSAAGLCDTFTKGSFKNYDDVMAFGQTVDYITIEIESVNTDALEALEKQGKVVHPAPHIVRLIQDKGLQKSFYADHQLPTSDFTLYDDAEAIKKDLEQGKLELPFVQKLRKDGYDGRGVQLVRTTADLDQLFTQPSVVESLVDIEKELAIIVARNGKGEVRTFPAIEMEFNPKANLVEFLFSPANIAASVEKEAAAIATRLITALGMQGILAVELFLTKSGTLLINEVAPRPHNSGHHTIEANITSQYEQALRALFDLPLGNTATIVPSVMVNLLGAEHYQGQVYYENLEECLAIEGCKVHLYGKTETKPFRKMGHATVIDNDLNRAKEKAKKVKDRLIVKTKT